MPLTGPIPEGRSFFCPRCGALYSVTYWRQWKSVDIGDDEDRAEMGLAEIRPRQPPAY